MASHFSFRSLCLQLGLLLAFLAGAKAASQCYYPNGDEASGDTPCYTDGRVTHCCGSDSICLTNQLCLSLNQPMSLSRGSCTDQSWGTSCPTYCKNAQQAGGAALVWYTNGTTGNTPAGEEPTYCCNSVIISTNDTLVCSRISGSTQAPFSIANGSVIADVAALDGLVNQSSSSGSSTIANNTGNDDTAKQSTSNAPSNNSKTETAIGAGVGVPLGLIALLSIGWALYERRLRNKMHQSPVSADGYGYQIERNDHPVELAELTGSEHKPAELYNSTTPTAYR